MTISATEAFCKEDMLWVVLSDGRRIGAPLSWFPWLENASPEDRADLKVSPFSLHWGSLDEDVPLSGLFSMTDSGGYTWNDLQKTEVERDFGIDEVQFPPNLFRYRSLDTDYALSELHNAIFEGSVFLSAAEVLNDPFDFRPSFSDMDLASFSRKIPFSLKRKKLLSRDRYIELGGQHISRNDFRKLPGNRNTEAQRVRIELSQIRAMLVAFPKDTRLACFSEVGNSIPMWAHYAADHSGFCLNYSLTPPRLKNDPDLFPLKVTYGNRRLKLSAADFSSFIDRKGTSNDKIGDDILVKLCLAKSDEWRYEREWRIFENSSKPPSYRGVPHLQLKSISLGFRVSDRRKAEVVERFGGDIAILQARLDEDEYDFVFEPIS